MYRTLLLSKAFVWIFGGIIGIIISLVIYQKHLDGQFNKDFATACANVNKGCPKMIDAITRLDGATIADNRTMRYHFTMLTDNHYNPQTVKDFLTPSLTAKYEKTAFFKKDHVICEYDFFEKDGKPITSIFIGGHQ
jgi:hypothetical protein